MRKIKFRGKRLDNGEWVYGYYIYYGLIDNQKHYIVPDYASTLYVFEVDPATVGQFTSLKDKNGKDGFESDILDTPIGKAVIMFGEYSQSMGGQEYHMGFYLKFENKEDADLYRKDIGYWLPRSVIIGNIHDREARP